MRRLLALTGIALLAIAAAAAAQAGGGFSISGAVWYDADGNGLRAPAEAPLAGYRLFLDADADSGLDADEATALTNADGRYTFSTPNAGTYTVRRAPDAAQAADLQGFSCTFPATGDCAHAVTVGVANPVSFGNSFGVMHPADSDGDTYPPPRDCDDGDAKIKPGAVEVKGNDVDENCDGVRTPFPKLTATVVAEFDVHHEYTKVERMTVLRRAAGTRIVLACRDGDECPFARKVLSPPDETHNVPLTPLFKKRKLAVGTVITVRITAPQTIGRLTTYTTRKNKTPRRTVKCLAPGSTRPQAC